MGRHAHVQIEYTETRPEKMNLRIMGNEFLGCPHQVESLIGFNPTSEKDRKFCHELLDEYLDYLARRWENNEDGELHECNHFEIDDLIHTE